MSIIHDALKKVQWAKTNGTEGTPQEGPANTETAALPMKNKWSSLLAMVLAVVITAGSLWYIYAQFKTQWHDQVPRVQRMAKASLYKLINKKEVPVLQPKPPAELKPLAKITINAPPVTVDTTNPAAKPPAPLTLNIHGIMSNASGNLVLINNSVYQEGDEIEGAKIIKISLDSITVNNNGIEQTIPVRN